MQAIILNQLLDLAFLHLICACHETLNKRVSKCYEPDNLVYQIDQHSCIWSHCRNGIANLHLQILEFSFGLTNSFHITGILRKSNLNGSDGRKWYAKIKMENEQIFTRKMIYLGYRLPGYLGPKSTCRFLKFTSEKRDVFRLLSIFDS